MFDSLATVVKAASDSVISNANNFSSDVDPSCFFSAMVQSSAAFIGLLGGFLGARIFSRQEKILEKKESIDKHILETNQLFTKIYSNYSSYREHLENSMVISYS